MDLIHMEETYCIEKIYSVMQGKLLRGTDLLIERKMINRSQFSGIGFGSVLQAKHKAYIRESQAHSWKCTAFNVITAKYICVCARCVHE